MPLWADEVVLNELNPLNESCGFRVLLQGPRFCGRGLGSEATRLVIDYAFDVVGASNHCLPEQVLGRGAQAGQDPLGPPLGHGFRASEHGFVDQVELQVGNVPHDREPRQRGQVIVT